MNKVLEKRLEKAFGIKEDSSPKIGIWYYLWFKPNWKLWTMPMKENKDWSHGEVWSASLCEDLGNHYRLSPSDRDRLRNLPYGLPRGRVDVRELIQGRPAGGWHVYHGDDFPSGLFKESELKKIIGLFDLTRLALQDQVKIVVVEHEKMSKSDKEEIQKILGPIPY